MSIEQKALPAGIVTSINGEIHTFPKGLAPLLVTRVMRGLDLKNRIDSGEYGVTWTSSVDNGSVVLDIPGQKGGQRYGLRQGVIKQVLADADTLAEMGFGETIAQVINKDRFLHGVMVTPALDTPTLREADRVLAKYKDVGRK